LLPASAGGGAVWRFLGKTPLASCVSAFQLGNPVGRRLAGRRIQAFPLIFAGMRLGHFLERLGTGRLRGKGFAAPLGFLGSGF